MRATFLFATATLASAALAPVRAQRSADIIADCRKVSDCAELIEPRKPAELTDGDRLREAALRTTILLSRVRSDGTISKAVETRLDGYCLAMDHLTNAVTPQIAAAVKVTYITAVPVDRCAPPPVGRAGGSTVTAGGIRGIFIMVGKLETDGDKATVETLGDGTSWSCSFERVYLGWQPTACRVTGGS